MIGNGINRITGVVSWNDVLKKIGGVVHDRESRPPNTLIYERAILEFPKHKDGIRRVEFDVKSVIAEEMKGMPVSSMYQDLFKLGFNHYMSTNYDYAFRDSILKDNRFSHRGESTEGIYSVRRYTSIMKGTQELCKVWQVHGELGHARTIMLGVDQYSGSVGRIDAYVKGNYSYGPVRDKVRCESIRRKLANGGTWDGVSWVELFFHTDVHILGFGLDYSEIDLWWVLVRRARMMNDNGVSNVVHNKVYYYAAGLDEDRLALLDSMHVTVVNTPKPSILKDEFGFYRDNLIRSISEIRRVSK